jgi:hypothetical protein
MLPTIIRRSSKTTGLVVLQLMLAANSNWAQLASSPGYHSEWVNLPMSVTTYSDYKADLGGRFDGVTLYIYPTQSPNIHRLKVINGGTGNVTNEKNEVIGEGQLGTVENWLAIPGKMGANFRFEMHNAPVSATWTAAPAKSLPLLSLSRENDWTIKDEHFSFLAELSHHYQGSIVVLLPESIVRGSIIVIPKGAFTLFGYRITAQADGAKVRFQRGAVTLCTGCISKKL